MTEEPTPGSPEPGRVRTTPTGVLVGWGLVGLIVGWALRPLAERFQGTAPIVTWPPVGVLFFVAAILGTTAWLTWRAVHVRRERLQPHQAVNRLVLAKACALVGALVSGGYFGYAVSWIGLNTELAGQRLFRSLVAGVAGLLIVIAAGALERACRVRKDDTDL